ncbi:PAS domain S-box protein [Natrinema salsiterrestre]|uniref:histidine kinase n=1 Tax=Natrinema salsiterrestre TaxID=2950540 RepID=A0A9Q4L303_9EURY|nr:PAS domain S-box protein [Natrinema salsiterrestre]MDF9747306.1 PAS domain S-box protein [Natrinema salsiterrestre]
MTDGDRKRERSRSTDALESPLYPFEEGEFFRQLVANTSEGLLTIDEESTIVFANPAIESILGYDPAELIGSSKMTLIPDRLQPAHAAGLEKYLRTGEKHIDWDGIELPAVHKHGHEVPVLVSLREHTHDGERLFTGLFRDISDRKARERRFEAVFNNTYHFTGLLDPDGTVLEVNETALAFAGLERDDVVGKPIWDTYWFQFGDESRETALEGVERAGEGELFRDEIRVRGNDRTAIIDFSIRPITDERGEIQLLVPEGRDVTPLKLREQHLRVLHRLLRHNLRNELNVIGGYAETLLAELTDEAHREEAAEIAAAAESLIELNESAKELADATLEDGRLRTPVAVGDVLETVVDDLRDRYPASTVTITGATDAVVLGDDRVATVLDELVQNAIVHTDESVVEIVVDEGTETVSVHVHDTGPGIPASERAGIFNDEPVTQVRHGNGLGLWLASLIVDDYGGYFDYAPRDDGEGSCVTVHLPRTQ